MCSELPMSLHCSSQKRFHLEVMEKTAWIFDVDDPLLSKWHTTRSTTLGTNFDLSLSSLSFFVSNLVHINLIYEVIVWKGFVGVQCSWSKRIFTRGMDDAEECPCSRAYARSISRDQRSRVEDLHQIFEKGVLARRDCQQSRQSWLPWMDWAHPKVSCLQVPAAALKL